MEKFKQNLTYLRTKVLNLSMRAMADTIKVSQGAFTHYESGKTSPGCDFILKVCNQYGVSANWLLMDIEPILLKDLGFTETQDPTIVKIENEKKYGEKLTIINNLVNELNEEYKTIKKHKQ